MEKRESDPRDKGQEHGVEKSHKQQDIGYSHEQDRRKDEEKRHAPGRSQDQDRGRNQGGGREQPHQGK
jgi:hypothetical protein